MEDLSLGLSIGNHYASKQKVKPHKSSPLCLDLSFTLCPKQEEDNYDDVEEITCNDFRIECRSQRFDKRLVGMEKSGHKEGDPNDDDEEEDANDKRKDNLLSFTSISNNINDNNNNNNSKRKKKKSVNGRKKLRLTKDQSTLLEDSFKLHTTLNPVQKHALAEQLNLTPRQVEVWFQNRRARTKLKQTEVDCELLKKWCERLGDENKRLKKELQQLRTLQFGRNSPLSLHLPISENSSP